MNKWLWMGVAILAVVVSAGYWRDVVPQVGMQMPWLHPAADDHRPTADSASLGSQDGEPREPATHEPDADRSVAIVAPQRSPVSVTAPSARVQTVGYSTDGNERADEVGGDVEDDASGSRDALEGNGDLAILVDDNDGTQVVTRDRSKEWQSPTEQQQQLEKTVEHERAVLNLSLPDIDWQQEAQQSAPASSVPNVFQHPEKQQLMGLSGKLYWDESEEAATKPITDTITGAEVELRIRLP